MATASKTYCYRHPDRETGVACSSCGRPICPSCMTPTPVGMRCPECSRQKTEVRTMSTLNTGTMPVTIGLIIVNVVLFLASGLGSINNTVTQKLWLTDYSIDVQHHYYTLVTSGFLHAGFIHILFNMYLLYVLGQLLEPAIGSVRFGFVYAVGLFAGSAGALLTASWNTPTLGASGAVFGLMGAAFFEMRNRGMDPMASGIGPLILFNLVLSFVISNISWGGHVGGLIGGSLAAILVHQLRRVRGAPKYSDYAVLAALVVVGIVVGISVAHVPAQSFTFG